MKNILLFYKKSAYKTYFLERDILSGKRIPPELRPYFTRFQEAHKDHYAALKIIESVLKKHGLSYNKKYRGQEICFKDYNLIITVGGDGTFLEAARHCRKQMLLGVNSSKTYSIGRFCSSDINNFERKLLKALNKQARILCLPRLKIRMPSQEKEIYAVNDILIANSNPAAMTRYACSISESKTPFTEEHRSSGMWISTAAGSTGAIRSAGAKTLRSQKQFQYLPRELYELPGKSYRFRGGVLKENQKINLLSLTRKGRIYCDGAHFHLPFSFGQKIQISLTVKDGLRTAV